VDVSRLFHISGYSLGSVTSLESQCGQRESVVCGCAALLALSFGNTAQQLDTHWRLCAACCRIRHAELGETRCVRDGCRPPPRGSYPSRIGHSFFCLFSFFFFFFFFSVDHFLRCMFIHAARGAYHPTSAGRAQPRHSCRTSMQARATQVRPVGDPPPPPPARPGAIHLPPAACGVGRSPPRRPPRTRTARRRLGLRTLGVPGAASGQSPGSPIDAFLSARY